MEEHNPNPYEAPRSEEQPVRALAKRLGVLGTLLVSLATLFSGVVTFFACCSTLASVAFPMSQLLGVGPAHSTIYLVIVLTALCSAPIVSVWAASLVSRRVRAWLTEKLSR